MDTWTNKQTKNKFLLKQIYYKIEENVFIKFLVDVLRIIQERIIYMKLEQEVMKKED